MSAFNVIGSCALVIEGVNFISTRAAYTHAVEKRGATCGRLTFAGRIGNGIRNWDELCKPADAQAVSSKKAKMRKREADRAEMAAIIAALDARKAAHA